jgi:hypothetical protein
LHLAAGSAAAAAALKAVHVISIARANNIAIMLTQFSAWSDEEIRAAVLDDSRLSAEKLSLLLQVRFWRLGDRVWQCLLQAPTALPLKLARASNPQHVVACIDGPSAPFFVLEDLHLPTLMTDRRSPQLRKKLQRCGHVMGHFRV